MWWNLVKTKFLLSQKKGALARHHGIFDSFAYFVHCYLATGKDRGREMAIKRMILVMEDGKVEVRFIWIFPGKWRGNHLRGSCKGHRHSASTQSGNPFCNKCRWLHIGQYLYNKNVKQIQESVMQFCPKFTASKFTAYVWSLWTFGSRILIQTVDCQVFSYVSTKMEIMSRWPCCAFSHSRKLTVYKKPHISRPHNGPHARATYKTVLEWHIWVIYENLLYEACTDSKEL